MIPRATYRVQFRGPMNFGRAAEIIPYLQRLGVSHLYASPLYAAVKGSTHGYDVIDHNLIEPSLGGMDGLIELSERLKGAGLGLILDIVPNHMAASLENRWWRHIVEWGSTSPFAGHFDVDWRRALTLPILGRGYAEALNEGEFSIKFDERNGCLAFAYFDNLLPLNPRSYREVLAPVSEPLAQQIADLAARAHPLDESWRDNLRHLLAGELGMKLNRQISDLSRDKSYLDLIHRAQTWRLMDWREARRTLSYRRFFEITGLVGVKVEETRVFDDVHRLTIDLVQRGIIDGLRIDHVDGLADPKAYLHRLRAAVGPDFYIVVEKILAEGEHLPADWPVQGTTGYEFISAMGQVLIDAQGYRALASAYHEDRGGGVDLETERRRAKLLIVRENFAGELATLVHLARQGGEFDSRQVELVIAELIAAMPVYRTYGDESGMNVRDREVLAQAAKTASTRAVGFDRNALHWLCMMLAEGQEEASLELRRRFQQLSGAVTAKAVEDTLFYRWSPMIALNEVGCDPAQEVGSIERFHATMQARYHVHPHGLLATATHDTKRGEDARARLYALSERPDHWLGALRHWRVLNGKGLQTSAPSDPGSGSDLEWLIYQSLASIWTAPGEQEYADLRKRILDYMEKALREAKLHTSWSNVDADYEHSVLAFVEELMRPDNVPFLDDLRTQLLPFVQAGWVNSLTQTLIKLTAPGVPDIYQGSETSDLSLVDPDNRRPVDFTSLSHCLAEPIFELDKTALQNGRMKQRLIAAGLDLRRSQPELFAFGKYEPLQVQGSRSGQVVAYRRRKDTAMLLAVAPRLTFASGLSSAQGRGFWQDTRIVMPVGSRATFMNVLSGEKIETESQILASELFASWPVALLATS